MCSWIAAGTRVRQPRRQHDSLSTSTIRCSGFQRVGDFIWAAGDMQSRGFLIGGTAGRTTLAGRKACSTRTAISQLVATTIPNLRGLRPTYAYELAVIVQDGFAPHVCEQENVFYLQSPA